MQCRAGVSAEGRKHLWYEFRTLIRLLCYFLQETQQVKTNPETVATLDFMREPFLMFFFYCRSAGGC